MGQLRTILFILLGSVVAGLLLPLGGYPWWACISLVLGVLCGHLAGREFAANATFWYRYCVIGYWISITVLACSAVWFVGEVAEWWRELSSAVPLGREPGSDHLFSHRRLWNYVIHGRTAISLVWVIHGLAISFVIALFVPSRLTALVIALVVSNVVTLFWLPSLVGGGLKMGLVLSVLGLLLVALWLILGAATKKGLHKRQRTRRCLGGAALAFAALAFGSGMRVLTVPAPAWEFDFEAFAASQSARDRDLSEKLLLAPARALLAHETEVQKRILLPVGPLYPPKEEFDNRHPKPLTEPEHRDRWGFHYQLDEVIERGWPPERTALEDWLEAMFTGPWVEPFREAARLPPLVVFDPQKLQLYEPLPDEEGLGKAPTLFTARALLRQKQRRYAEALDEICVVLGLSRHYRNHSRHDLYRLGEYAEVVAALNVLEQWMAHADVALLRKAAEALSEHERLLPSLVDCVKLEFSVLHRDLDEAILRRATVSRKVPKYEEKLLVWARTFPWEAERERRSIQTIVGTRLQALASPWHQLNLLDSLPFFAPQDIRDVSYGASTFQSHFRGELLRYSSGKALTTLRARRLQLALCVHQKEGGALPMTLAELTPRFFRELPLDPYTGGPFGYRISKGEKITDDPFGNPREPPMLVIPVASGQAILWSVGPDRVDHGGLFVPSSGYFRTGRNPAEKMDMVFVVPLVEKSSTLPADGTQRK